MRTRRTTPAWLLLGIAALPGVAACTAAHGIGVCDPPCASPLSCCAGVCLDRATDARNCGACGVLCRPSQACVGGVCTRATDAGPSYDAAALDARMVDDAGACRPACIAPAVCLCGGCARSPSGVASGDGRADATFANCGACGVACNPTTASRCGQLDGAGPLDCRCGDGAPCDLGSTCQVAASMPGGFVCVGALECGGPGAPPCPPGHDCVDGRCECGALGHRCEAGATCSGGACLCGGVACSPGTACDGFACVDVSSDPNNCGAIGRFCGAGQGCALGMCVCGGTACPPGWGCVAGACADLTSDPQNCGLVGLACAPGETCSLGVCRCGAGLGCSPFGPIGCARMCCGGACVDSTVTHCAACGDVCGPGESCASVPGVTGSHCVDRTMIPEATLCGAGAGPLCEGVDCSTLTAPCAIGVCDERTGTCVAVQRSDGATCSAGPPCRSGRCVGGSCVLTDDPLCQRCVLAPGGTTFCRSGSCGPSPTSVRYDFETDELPALWGLVVHGAPWLVSSASAHGGAHAAQAGPTPPGAESVLGVPFDVGGPTRVSLWVAIDADPATDALEIWLNGVLLEQLRGASGWREVVTVLDLAPGPVELVVRFVRGAGSSVGAGSAWVDDITFESALPGEPLCR